MSVTHLEDLVQIMVKSTSASADNSKATKAVDGPNWRETLHRLVTRCYSSSYRTKDRTKPRRRDRSRSGDHSCRRLDKMNFANTIELANSVMSEYSPVVSLYDVLKFKPNEDDIPPPSPPPQDEFLYYFGLSLNNNLAGNHKTEKNEHKLYTSHHPRNLINTPQVPFSSDLGIKLIKERPEIPLEIHERKLERLERFLQVIPNSDDVEYEVIYNKKDDLDSAHFYSFPTKNFHDKNKLTPKARHLLKKYCKPCTVKLLPLDMKNINHFVPRHIVQKNSEQDQKENIKLLKNKGIYLESKVVLTNNFLKPTLKTFLSNKPIPKMDDKKTRHQNLSKTLTPRNENTIDIKKKDSSRNIVNACVVLQPINNFLEAQRSTRGSENCNTAYKKVSKGKIVRRRTQTYYPRRFSPRLQLVNTPLIM